MKRIVILLAAVALAASCVININGIGVPVIGNGESADKSFDLGDFDGISVLGAMDVVYVQDLLETSVVLRTDENLLDLYKIEVKEGVLTITNEPGKNPMPKTGAVVTVHSPAINSMTVSGSGDCSIPYTLTIPDDFRFKVSGSGDLDANLIVCKNFTSKISGSGDIEVKSLTARSTDISISGSGDAEIGCNGAGDIDARISGSGSIKLHGIAKSLNTKVSGSGDINTSKLRLTGE